MTFGKGPLLLQKYEILQKSQYKLPYIVTLKVEQSRERFNMYR